MKETTPKSWLALPILAMSVEDDFFWRARVILKSAKKYFFVDSAERPQRIDFLAKNEANVVPVFPDPLSHRFVCASSVPPTTYHTCCYQLSQQINKPFST